MNPDEAHSYLASARRLAKRPRDEFGDDYDAELDAFFEERTARMHSIPSSHVYDEDRSSSSTVPQREEDPASLGRVEDRPPSSSITPRYEDIFPQYANLLREDSADSSCVESEGEYQRSRSGATSESRSSAYLTITAAGSSTVLHHVPKCEEKIGEKSPPIGRERYKGEDDRNLARGWSEDEIDHLLKQLCIQNEQDAHEEPPNEEPPNEEPPNEEPPNEEPPNEEPPNEEEEKDGSECAICLDAPINAVVIPCGHAHTCLECARKLDLCPMCRVEIEKVVQLFMG